MLTFKRVKIMSKIAFPLSVAISANLVMDLIDIGMVGRLGHKAVAAVGLAAFSNTLILALVGGIAAAVQGIVARRRGEGSTEPLCKPLNGGILLALAIGVPLAVVCYWLTPLFFSMISSDPEVTRLGTPFLRLRYLAIPASGMLYAFKGFWAGVERTRTYMLLILFMDLVNIAVNYVLIFGHFGAPAMGVAGAAVGTLTAIAAGLIANFAIASYRLRGQGFLTAKPERSLLARIYKLAMPANMQEFFFSLGYIVLFWIVGKVGTAELAAMNVQVRVGIMMLIVAAALGQTSATLVSRTVGEGDIPGAVQWGWDAGKLGVITSVVMGLPLVLFPKFFLSIFLHNPHVIDIATVPFQMITGTAGLGSLIWIFAYTLYSVGDGTRVMIVSFCTQWLFFLPLVYVLGPRLHYGLLQISIAQIAWGFISTVLIVMIWAQGRWKTVRI
jgi:multidrug resistance protein, MATE family